LTTRQPWVLCGMSRSSWYRAWHRGAVPAPLKLPGTRNVWLLAHVLEFLNNLGTLDAPRPGCGRPRKTG
jgi:predicted DNA-binding transcriptional regulator AlpA